ncbi:glycosyltransferase family 39 protein [Rhodobacteraceae bacterium RKSG542]|uniref:ArnT family glycosyltransferase n=1 Tax=Pseudovibrio flavus TaxID=2529854 RepID=UPI0012BBAD5A|nr:glycosyltransferase family 39 protein [Pseudovibrio flavus]MTI16345.1 glycosyltransferase family 39 protein [Pseudovibrio flavus]
MRGRSATAEADARFHLELEQVPWWARPRTVVAIVLGYFLFNLGFRSFGSPILGTDDMFENVYVQDFLLGYTLRQPPFYEWYLYAVQQVTGPTIWAFQIVKYSLIAAAGLFLYAAARKAIADERLSALAVFSYTLFYQIGFNLHEGVTHTSVLILAIAMSLYAFMRYLERATFWNAVLLGIAFGLGMLAKHSFALVPIGLFLAALFDSYWRRRFALVPLVITAATALLVYSPYLFWVLGGEQNLLSASVNNMVLEKETSHLSRVLSGELKLLTSSLGFLVPFIVLVPLVFFRSLFPKKARRAVIATGEPTQDPLPSDYGRLMGQMVIFTVLLTAVGILVSGATYIKERHMHPLFMALPLYLFSRIAIGNPSDKAVRVFASICLALVVVVASLRLVGFIAPDKTSCGGYCRHMKPYDQLATSLSEKAPAIQKATIVSLDHYTGGNLRAFLPDARHVISSYRPLSPAREVCFLVWDAGDKAEAKPFEQSWGRSGFDPALKPLLADVVDMEFVQINWPHIVKPEGYRITNWGYLRLSSTAAICQ